jgi:hypothetical protein
MTRLSRCGPTAGRRSPFSDVTGLSTAPSSSAMSSPSLCFRRSPPASYRLMARAMAIGGDRALSGCPSGSGFSTVGLAFILTSSSLMSVLQLAISSGGPRLPSSSSVPRPASLRCRSLACSSFRFSSPATCRSRPSCLSPRTEVGRRSAMVHFFWACWHWDCPTESHRVFSCVPAPLAALAASLLTLANSPYSSQRQLNDPFCLALAQPAHHPSRARPGWDGCCLLPRWRARRWVGGELCGCKSCRTGRGAVRGE